MKKNKVKTKELGLIAGLIFGKYFFETEDLHFGFWTDDIEVNKNNFAKAQENYSNFIISHIPENAKTILDVGCGAGGLASKLLNMRFSVDCVSPDPLLTERALEILGDRSTIFRCLFEEMESDKLYDTLIFSESFQYIKLSAALLQSLKFLKQGGHLLICDFFKTEAHGDGQKGDRSFGGGHRMTKFYAEIQDTPFVIQRDDDITSLVSPNIQLVNDLLMNKIYPASVTLDSYVKDNYSVIYFFKKLAFRIFRKKLKKIKYKYFSGYRSKKVFERYKTYRLIVLQYR